MKTPKTIITKAWADDGDKVPINTEVTPDSFCWPLGAGPNFQLPLDTGGIAIPREGFNGIFNVLSETLKYIQYGNRPPFDPRIAEDTGYDLGAVIRYYPDPNNPQFSYELISMKANNKDNPITTPGFIGSSWMPNNTGIIDSGSNANGTYFKFANGLVIQWSSPSGVISVGQDVVTRTFTFPVPFISNQYLAFSTFTAEAWNKLIFTWFNHTGKLSTSVTLSLYYHQAGATATMNQVMIMAVGLWRSL